MFLYAFSCFLCFADDPRMVVGHFRLRREDNVKDGEMRAGKRDPIKMALSIDVWKNCCQGRQNPILRPNEI